MIFHVLHWVGDLKRETWSLTPLTQTAEQTALQLVWHHLIHRSSCYCSVRRRYEKYLQEKPHQSRLVCRFKINEICHIEHNFLNLLIKLGMFQAQARRCPCRCWGGAHKAQRRLKNLGWVQAASDHQSWEGECKAEGLWPYFHLLKMFTWQLCLQATPQSLTGQWCKSETHSHWKIKAEDPEGSFGPPQDKHKFHLICYPHKKKK